MLAIEQVIIKVQDAFKNGCPNGFLLGWDVNRFYDLLVAVCDEFKVTNDTDFNYSYCNSYDVKFKYELDGYIYKVTLKVSFIADAFSLHITQYSGDLKRGKVVSITNIPKLDILHKKVKEFIEDKGFLEIDCKAMDIVLDDIDLELAEQATLGKCLFDDFE